MHTFQTQLYFINTYLTVLYNAYFKRTAHRQFATNASDTATKSKPNYMIRILFVTALMGGGAAYYFEWTDDIIEFSQKRFKYLSALNDKKDKKSSAFKLPKPSKSAVSSDQTSSDIRTISTIEPNVYSKQKIVTIPISEISEPSQPVESKQKIKNIAVAKVVKPKVKATKLAKTDQIKAAKTENIRNEISDEMIQNFDKIKSEAARISNSETKVDVSEQKVYKTESERYIAEISELRKAMNEVSIYTTCECAICNLKRRSYTETIKN